MILKCIVLMLLMTKIAVSYKQYKYSELCPVNKFKTMFDTMTDNRPVVRLSDGDGSAALIRYYSNKSNGKKIGSCEFNVKLDNPGSTDGMFASIKKLKLRENTYDGSCKDFLRFTYKNGTSTREICGNIDTSVHNNLIRNFFDETAGELKVEISIDTSYSTVDDLNGLEVYLVFTAYSNCSPKSSLQCSPDKCISDIYRDDEILNCPPPGCLDESNCVNNEKPSIVSVESGSSSSSGYAHIIIPIVIVCAVTIGLLCFCKKQKAASNNNPTPTPEHVEELRPTAQSDLDSYLQFQDVRTMPIVPDHTQYRPLPFTPNDEHRGPMPLVPPDQRYDRPMPSAPPTGYRDEPPPYDALFSKNQNTRTNV